MEGSYTADETQALGGNGREFLRRWTETLKGKVCFAKLVLKLFFFFTVK